MTRISHDSLPFTEDTELLPLGQSEQHKTTSSACCEATGKTADVTGKVFLTLGAILAGGSGLFYTSPVIVPTAVGALGSTTIFFALMSGTEENPRLNNDGLCLGPAFLGVIGGGGLTWWVGNHTWGPLSQYVHAAQEIPKWVFLAGSAAMIFGFALRSASQCRKNRFPLC